jgi:hypothetical protein
VRAPNRLAHLLPEAGRRADVIRVIDPADTAGAPRLPLCADPVKRSFLWYLKLAA